MKARMFTDENRKWWTLVAVSFGLFMIMLDNTVVNVALPSIRSDLGISVSELEWVVNAYALTFGVLLLTGGKLADLLGRRAIFIAGLVVFTGASLWCGLAGGAASLIAARTVQGVGAALMNPATLSIITATFPPRLRGTAIGIWAGVSALALAIGPLVGGVITERISWSWIFFVNVPVGDRRRAGGASVHRRDEGHVARAAARPSRSGQLRRRALRPHLRADRDEYPSMGLDAGDRPARPRRGRTHGVRAARGASAPPDARPALCSATRPSAGRTRSWAWSGSRCSASSSSTRCSCRTSSATARSRPAPRSCR